MMMLRTVPLCLLLLLALLPCCADIFIISNQSSTLTPAETRSIHPVPVEEPQISMDAETVAVVENSVGVFTVSCTFTMRSHAATELQRTIGFPFTQQYGPDFMNVTVNGQAVKGDLMPMGDNLKDEPFWALMHPGSYRAFYVWPVSWKPHETKTIRCTYGMGQLDGYYGLVVGWQLQYVVRTGAYWKGPIGKADISVTFQPDGGKSSSHSTDGRYAGLSGGNNAHPALRLSYSQQARWVAPNKVVWRFTNWEPTEDITIDEFTWKGRMNWYTLPDTYQGTIVRYTTETLDAQVDRMLAPWKTRFAKEMATFDRAAARKYVAEHLYYEIIARQQCVFLNGPVLEVISSDGEEQQLRKHWQRYFLTYLGGWYHPDGKKTLVKVADLTETERANLAFLRLLVEKPLKMLDSDM